METHGQNDVALRMSGVTDLTTADAQYYQRRYNAYRNPLLTPAECAPLISDTAVSSVIGEMDCNWEQTWTVADLYKRYQEYDGQIQQAYDVKPVTLLRRTTNDPAFRRLCKRHGILKVYIKEHETCSPERRCIRRRENRGDCVQDLTRSQSNAKVLNHDDLDQFTYSNTCESTSETLLTLVSRLVSKEKKNTIALSISQCVQQHIALSPNQTTLGLALKLHYKFGSAEIVRLTHEHGLSDGR